VQRTLLALVAAAVVVVLGAIQLASSAAYGDLAPRISLPAFLHAHAPGLFRPLLGDTAAQAAAAIHNGDLSRADTLVASLPDDATSADLRGRLAEARGDSAAAIAAYVRAGDVVRAQTLIDTLAEREPATALRDEQALVTRLGDDPNAAEVTGQAWWRLGQLQALAGYRDPSHRTTYWREAERSYERALAFAPNEETYLLAAGYQSLANGDANAALRWYTHAAEVVPNSADAYAGLAWTAAARGDCTAARSALLRSRSLRSTSTRDPIDDPLVGPALRRCTT
jgi:tetratricopeptide (TPR) repeat protein